MKIKIGIILIMTFMLLFCLIYGNMSVNMKPVYATVRTGGGIANFIGLSSDTKPTGLSGAGQTFYETNTGLTYIYDGSAWVVTGIYAVGDTTSFTTPGTSSAVYCRGYGIGGYYFSISAINTTVTMVLEGKVGNSNWTAIDTDSTRYTTNDNYGLITSNIAMADSMRLRFLSEEGGTDGFVNYNSTLGRTVR